MLRDPRARRSFVCWRPPARCWPRSFELAEPLRHVAQLAVARLADVVLIDLLGEKGDLSRVAMAFAEADPAEAPSTTAIAPEDLALLRRVLSSGRPILVGKNAAGGSVQGSVGNVALGAKSLMLLPLMSRRDRSAC